MICHDPRVAAILKVGRLNSLDPAIRHPAIAVFQDGILQHARRVKVPGKVHELDDIGDRARIVAQLCADDIYKARDITSSQPTYFAYERPKVYTNGKSKGDPADLIALALVAGGVAALLNVPTYSPEPGQWSVGKKLTKGDPHDSPRFKIVWSRLSPAEHLVLEAGLSHDAVDAVGIALHLLGRLGKNYFGST